MQVHLFDKLHLLKRKHTTDTIIFLLT